MTKPDSRSQHMLNIYSKELAAEVIEWAAKEEQAAGLDVPKNTLARKIFAWAWPLYKQAGSLAELRKLQLVAPNKLAFVEPSAQANSARDLAIADHARSEAAHEEVSRSKTGKQAKPPKVRKFMK